MLVQQGLHKALKGKWKKKAANMEDEDSKDLDLRAISAIFLCLADDVLYNYMKS